jgi:hypothetical protein
MCVAVRWSVSIRLSVFRARTAKVHLFFSPVFVHAPREARRVCDEMKEALS